MKLLTKALKQKLIKNFEINKANPENTKDFKPVVKFFGGNATWLLSEFNPETEVFFGLCDLGLGFPELGYVSKAELESIKLPPLGLPIERDQYWEADKTLMEYTKIASQCRHIKT